MNKRIFFLIIAVLVISYSKNLARATEDGQVTQPTKEAPKARTTPSVFYDITVEYGEVTFGAEPPVRVGESHGLNFLISDVVPIGDEDDRKYLVLGIRMKDVSGGVRGVGLPEVVRALTRDGINFVDEEVLFAAPAGKRYFVADTPHEVALSRNDGRLLLMACELGRPSRSGHYFHVFGANKNESWQSLAETPVYRGQDAFGLVWNQEQDCWVNYQITYQPHNKRHADNMGRVRRVLNIRTSPDGVSWTPGGSSGVKGPYLPEDQLITPDGDDHPDTEFYKFKPFFHRGMWMGAMVKYASQPKVVGVAPGYSHGPFMESEWWISRDGFSWCRPFRGTSQLDAMPQFFSYFMHPPFVVAGELRWVTGRDVYAIPAERMFYLQARHNTEIITKAFVLEDPVPQLHVSFNSPRIGRQDAMFQGYVMAELLTPDGIVIPGCERENCLHHASNESILSLKWGDGSAAQSYLGKQVRLRLYMRDVKLYALPFLRKATN